MATPLNEDRLWMHYVSLEYPSKDEFNQKRKEIEAYVHEHNINWKQYFKELSLWTWDESKRAECFVLSNRNTSVSRPSGGSNPVIYVSKPFTRLHHKISFRVDEFDDWAGIGLADEDMVLDGGSVLGSQDSGINSSVFTQGGTSLKMRHKTHSEGERSLTKQLAAGVVVTVDIDFNVPEVKYYLDGEMVGKCDLTPSQDPLRQGKLFPAVAFARGTAISILKTHPIQHQLEEEMEALSLTDESTC